MPIDRFISYLRYELNRAQLTVEAYERDLRQFSDWITANNKTQFRPKDITTSDVRAWLASLARDGVSPRSIRRKVQSLRAFFKYLLRKQVISSDPTSEITLPKIPKQLPDFVRQEEVEGVLRLEERAIERNDNDADLEDELRNHLIIELLYSLGIRRAELIAISDNDISFSSGEIKITGKRSKQRIVPVPELLLQHIRRWQQMRDRLWPDTEIPKPLIMINGERITPIQVYQIVNKELASTSARKKSPHALRHTFATTMLNEGADINTVKEFLGHASLATTQIYTHISFAEMRKAYQNAHPRLRNTPNPTNPDNKDNKDNTNDTAI